MALGQCSSLAVLDLSYNSIGDEGAGRLAGVLGQCSSLAELDLRDNRIGVDGAERLAGGLGECPSLTELHLFEGNAIGEDAKAMLLSSIRETTRLL